MMDKRQAQRTKHTGIQERVSDHNGKKLTRYRIRYRVLEDGKWKERYETFASIRDAQNALADRRSAKNKGLTHDPALGRETFSSFWARWYSDAQTLGRPRTSTLAKYETVWRVHVSPALGSRSLASITRTHVQEMVKNVAVKSSAYQATEALKLTRMLLYLAMDDGAVLVNRGARISPPKVERKRPRVLTPQQLARLSESIPERYRALVLLDAWGALRWSEIVGLELDAVNFLGRQVRIERSVVEVKAKFIVDEPKTRKARRTIPLSEFVVKVLARHVELFPPKDTAIGRLIFTTERGYPIHRHTFRVRVWKPAVKAAGLEGFTVRHPRHTGASLVLEAGGSLKDVAERLGHTNTRMADELYVELFEERGHEIAKRLNEIAFASQKRPTDIDATNEAGG